MVVPPREITRLSYHAELQATSRDGGRGVSDEAMHDAVKNPIRPVEKQDRPLGPTFKYRGRNAVVVLNEHGEVVTCYGTDREGLRDP